MAPSLKRFAQKLGCFLQNKYFNVVGESEYVRLINESISHFSSGYTEDIGIAVLMLSYTYRNGGWTALDAVAKKVSAGYEALELVIDGENPCLIVPMEAALQYTFAVREAELRRNSKKVEDDHRKISEGVCNLENNEQLQVTSDTLGDKSFGDTGDIEYVLPENYETISHSEPSITDSSNVQPSEGVFDETQLQLTKSSKYNKSIDLSFGAVDDILDTISELTEDYSCTELPVTDTINEQSLYKTRFHENQLELTEDSKCNKSIDMTFGSMDDFFDPASEFCDEDFSFVEDSSSTDPLNVQHLSEAIVTKKIVDSETLKGHEILEKKGSCEKQDTSAESHKKFEETASGSVSKSRQKRRRRNRRANRNKDPVSDTLASTPHTLASSSNYDSPKKSAKPECIEKIGENLKPDLSGSETELERRKNILDECTFLTENIDPKELLACDCCEIRQIPTAISTQQLYDRPENETIHYQQNSSTEGASDQDFTERDEQLHKATVTLADIETLRKHRLNFIRLCHNVVTQSKTARSTDENRTGANSSKDQMLNVDISIKQKHNRTEKETICSRQEVIGESSKKTTSDKDSSTQQKGKNKKRTRKSKKR